MASGLSKIALEWMLYEAYQVGLKIDVGRALAILGRMAYPAPAFVEEATPNPASIEHHSLHGPWWILECLPHGDFDIRRKRVKWTIPLGTRRLIPDGSLIHGSVSQRMQLVAEYRPTNLPHNFRIEQRNIFPGPSELQNKLRQKEVSST